MSDVNGVWFKCVNHHCMALNLDDVRITDFSVDENRCTCEVFVCPECNDDMVFQGFVEAPLDSVDDCKACIAVAEAQYKWMEEQAEYWQAVALKLSKGQNTLLKWAELEVKAGR